MLPDAIVLGSSFCLEDYGLGAYPLVLNPLPPFCAQGQTTRLTSPNNPRC